MSPPLEGACGSSLTVMGNQRFGFRLEPSFWDDKREVRSSSICFTLPGCGWFCWISAHTWLLSKTIVILLLDFTFFGPVWVSECWHGVRGISRQRCPWGILAVAWIWGFLCIVEAGTNTVQLMNWRKGQTSRNFFFFLNLCVVKISRNSL